MRLRHLERHRTERIGWLRAAVLGANDGIVSTASLVLGVAAAEAGRPAVLVAGVAGLGAGAMSMAAGEYVSVSSQADTERADLERERGELAASGPAELEELATIYIGRGLTPALAHQVAKELMAHDALGAHARDELGISRRRAAIDRRGSGGLLGGPCHGPHRRHWRAVRYHRRLRAGAAGRLTHASSCRARDTPSSALPLVLS
jgi:VIT1/CCC1 family predicted Fe2+/Mn2+ transporter